MHTYINCIMHSLGLFSHAVYSLSLSPYAVLWRPEINFEAYINFFLLQITEHPLVTIPLGLSPTYIRIDTVGGHLTSIQLRTQMEWNSLERSEMSNEYYVTRTAIQLIEEGSSCCFSSFLILCVGSLGRGSARRKRQHKHRINIITIMDIILFIFYFILGYYLHYYIILIHIIVNLYLNTTFQRQYPVSETSCFK
jgi:hypothetical protein